MRYKGRKVSPEVIAKMKKSLHPHHIYLKENGDQTIKLTNSKHRQLHEKAYNFIYDVYGKKGIDRYLKWFDKKYHLKGKKQYGYISEK